MQYNLRIKYLCPVITKKGYPFNNIAVQTYSSDIFKRKPDRKKSIRLPNSIAQIILYTRDAAHNAKASI